MNGNPYSPVGDSMGQSISIRSSWIWIEKLKKATGLTDLFVGGLIGFSIFLLYFALGIYVGNLITISTKSFIEFIALLVASIAIVYLVIENLHLILILKDIPSLMNLEGDSVIDDLNEEIWRGFSSKSSYFGIIFLIVVPFIMLDFWFFLVRPDSAAALRPENWRFLAFDIIGDFIAYFIEFLIATIIWIIINIYRSINLLGSRKYRSHIKIDLFSIDGIGGLGKAVKSTKGIAIYYFAGLTLVILAFVLTLASIYKSHAPSYYVKLQYAYLMQIFLYIILLIVGLYYICSIYSRIKNIFDIYVSEEDCKINKIYYEKRNRLQTKLSEIGKNANYDEIKQLRIETEIISSDKENLTRSVKRGYDLSAIITIAGSFLGSLVIPFLTMIELLKKIMVG
jgi:hypothetical protein